jgi:hypothetical protein
MHPWCYARMVVDARMASAPDCGLLAEHDPQPVHALIADPLIT